ncbi:ABC-type metal ion transporter, periplasmic subunit [Selenomonas sputigena ATCC 35185]|uniref:ABC-type metal ion transporter, periplasmic subunit n=1 Tax=Selenomonas sputigena (strain ATCC 35185 / DSM 20758 / CCUG 44933 / VPI D19B-28) TaxID=546271 RepID=F4F0H6_SELS3|nr:ABC-type metal ion transporter, periplasmic subunit [Selenomonas sputigena ATCC 35185]
MKRKNMFLCLLTALCLLLTGCGGTNTAGGGKDGSFHIVTSFYPMYVATINITQGVDGVTVTNMTKPQTGCLHDYQLMTEDMKTLEKADAFVINGAGMESFLDKVVEQQKNLKIIDASKGIELLKDDDEENPHVWLSVTDAILQVKNIAEQLKAADPKHADAYEKNAAAYIKKLEALKAEMHTELDTVPNKDIVTFHEAFPYFAKEFGLNIISVVEREPGTEPTPAELQATIEQVKKLPVKVLFTEPQYSPSAAETIARETGAKIYTLDPVVTGEANDQALNAYIDTMKKNMETLKTALQ